MVHNLSTAELRKMLREQRKKTAAPSKMKKHELIAELEKHGIHERSSSPEKSPTPALPVKEKKVAPKKEEHSKKETKKEEPMKEEKMVKKEKKSTTSSAAVPANEGVKKMVKGSQEARDRMAALRAMRSSKKNVD